MNIIDIVIIFSNMFVAEYSESQKAHHKETLFDFLLRCLRKQQTKTDYNVFYMGFEKDVDEEIRIHKNQRS